jgi:iron complex outermembrane receptor protein
MNYWLFKSEPDAYSIEDLRKEPKKTGRWDGIRNYQARNLLRDEVKKGDQLFFYHSNAKPSGIVGLAEVVKTAYPDPAQFNPESKYFDPKATEENPRWYSVDVKFKQKFERVISLAELKSMAMGKHSPLANMVLLKQGRLSVQPVSVAEWKSILKALCLTCLSLLIIAPGFFSPKAQAAELETVVVTGRAGENSRGDIAGSVGVVDTLDLSLIQASHINEAADRIAGVWISRGNGQEHLTAIRSPVFTGPGSCGSFLVLHDGIPTRPAGFCNVNQLFEINSEQADRIEVYRGPNGGVYGNNALHGIINVISPKIGNVERGSLMLDGGPHDYARGFFSYTDGKSLAVHGHMDHDGGYKDDSGFDQQKVNIKHVNKRQDIRVETFLEMTNLNQETAGYIEGEDAYKDDSQKKDNFDPQSFRDAKSAHAHSKLSGVSAHGHEWQLTPYANTSRMEFLQHWIPTDPLEKNGHHSAGLNGRFSYPVTLSDQRMLSIVSGFNIEAGRAYVDEFQSSPTLAGFVQDQHYDFDVMLQSAALFSEMEYSLSEAITLIAGLRYDYQYYDYDTHTLANTTGNYTRLADRDDEFGNVGINVGMIWAWSDNQQVFLNGSNGYRAPEVAELYRLEGGVPAEAVESEKIRSLEFGLRGNISPLWGESVFYELAFFDMYKDHVILKQQNRQYLGDGETSHRGIEVGFDYRFLPTAYLKASATYAEHRYEDIDGQLQGSPPIDVDNNIIDTAPRHFGSLQLGKIHSWGLIEIEWKHMGPYYLDPEHDWEYEGHDLINIRAQYWQRSDVKWTARLLNIMDIDYAERADVNITNQPRYFVGEPRSLYLSVEKTF